MKLQTLCWAGIITRIGESRAAFNLLVGELKREDHTLGQSEDGREISERLTGRRCNNLDEWREIAEDRYTWRSLNNAV